MALALIRTNTDSIQKEQGTSMKKSILLAMALLPFVGVTTSWAQESPGDEYSRAGKFEAFAVGQYGHIALADVSTGQVGIGVGYNVIDQINIHASLAGGFIGAGVGDIDVSTGLFSGHLGLDYNILRTRLTPYLTAGGGFYYVPVASTVLSSLNMGVGCRWDFNDRWFAKAAYEPTLLMHDVGGVFDNVFSLSVGMKF